MKKIIYLLAPLMCFSTLVSCNNGGGEDPEPKIDYEVTEEEFNNALEFKGIEFMQSEIVIDFPQYEINDSPGTFKTEMSSSMYHFASRTKDDVEWNEKFVEKINENEYKKYRKENDFKPEPAEEKEFLTPENNEYTSIRIWEDSYFKINYTNFDYDKEDCSYKCWTEVISNPSEKVNLVLKFENKKVAYFDILVDGFRWYSYKYSYEEITPELPK